MKTSEVLLITRVRTNNKGNQALSAAWVRMLEASFPGAQVNALERRPHHLLQFTLDQFRRAHDPFREFDRITTALAKLAPGAHEAEPVRSNIALDESIVPQPPFMRLRQRLNLRRWAARAGRYRAAYQLRLAAGQRARLVVVNPAGEFFPHDPVPALYHLLDAHVMHKLGTPTAIVNHTMDLNDPTLRTIIPRLYRQLALVGFRDEPSIHAFEKMGGSLSNVVVTPDLALTTNVRGARPKRPGTIAVAIHTPDAMQIDRAAPWVKVIKDLKAAGFKVVLVSNELPSDRAFFDHVQRQVSVPVEGQGLDYDRYAELLASYDFVVTSRMHTGILAMCAGTPVIPIEGPSFKITGLFGELGLPISVIQPREPGWTDLVIERAIAMRDRRAESSEEFRSRLTEIREQIPSTLIPKLRNAANADGQGAWL